MADELDAGPGGADEEYWRSVLEGTDEGVLRGRRLFGHMPAPPRCKICGSPFQGMGRVVSLLLRHRRSTTNPLVCTLCLGTLQTHPGGARVDMSVVFADVRGSSGIAERHDSASYRALIQSFYSLAVGVIDRNDGILDKFLGDGVMALFIPLVSGLEHPKKAISTARELLRVMDEEKFVEAGMYVGVGVNSGVAYAGSVGTDDRLDFTALGDTVNIAAKLGSAAGPGQALISRTSWERDHETGSGVQVVRVPIAGKSADIEAIALSDG